MRLAHLAEQGFEYGKAGQKVPVIVVCQLVGIALPPGRSGEGSPAVGIRLYNAG
jgi:hypothetical protein